MSKRTLITKICLSSIIIIGLTSCAIQRNYTMDRFDYDEKLPSSINKLGKVDSIRVVHEDEFLFTCTNPNIIDICLAQLTIAKVDKSKDDFKSFDFAYFYFYEGDSIRIELFGDRIRYYGKRYNTKGNIQVLLNTCFDT